MSESSWYYQFMGDEVGPHSIEGLKALAFDGTLLPEMLVRREGDQWRTAVTFEELFIEGLEHDREFLGLCLQITKDGTIDRDELHRLKVWLKSNKAYHQVPVIASLILLWNRITADRVVDKYEQTELFNSLADLLPPIHKTAVLNKRNSLTSKKPNTIRRGQGSVATYSPRANSSAYGYSRYCRRCDRQLKTRWVLCYKCDP